MGYHQMSGGEDGTVSFWMNDEWPYDISQVDPVIGYKTKIDPESGLKTYIMQSGAIMAMDPAYLKSPGVTWNAPTFVQGGEGGSVTYQSQTVATIAGFSVDSFIPIKNGADWLVLNPKTGAPDVAVMLNDDSMRLVPLSLAQQYLPGFYRFVKEVQNSGGFFEDVLLPGVIMAIATAGVGAVIAQAGWFSTAATTMSNSAAELSTEIDTAALNISAAADASANAAYDAAAVNIAAAGEAAANASFDTVAANIAAAADSAAADAAAAAADSAATNIAAAADNVAQAAQAAQAAQDAAQAAAATDNVAQAAKAAQDAADAFSKAMDEAQRAQSIADAYTTDAANAAQQQAADAAQRAAQAADDFERNFYQQNFTVSPPVDSPSFIDKVLATAEKQGVSMLTNKTISAGLAAILGGGSAPKISSPGVIAARTIQAAPRPVTVPVSQNLIGANLRLIQGGLSTDATGSTLLVDAGGQVAQPIDQSGAPPVASKLPILVLALLAFRLLKG